jgi:hypothetical protein
MVARQAILAGDPVGSVALDERHTALDGAANGWALRTSLAGGQAGAPDKSCYAETRAKREWIWPSVVERFCVGHTRKLTRSNVTGQADGIQEFTAGYRR